MAFSTRFITGIRWHKDFLQMLNNMTYIYDPNWNPDNSVKATLPVCFMHVKGMHEVLSSEISQKQMLFYNSTVENDSTGQTSNNSDPKLDSGLLNVVADNIVIKPKVYKLDVVIPYKNLTLLNQSFVFNTFTAQAINATMIGLGRDATEESFNSLISMSSPLASFLKTLLTTLVAENMDLNSTELSFSETLFKDVIQQPDYNKLSLETMWKMRRIVKMKVWNSWEYKYVAIVDVDTAKEGTEDGVYQGTITLQEVPIMTMFPESRSSDVLFQYKNELIRKRGRTAINILDRAGGQK